MTDTFRALCAALVDEAPYESPTTCLARAALSLEGAGVAPTDEELLKVYQRAVSAKVESIIQTEGDYTGSIHEHAAVTLAGIHAAIARYTTHPRPIPVSERLATEADCDDKGRCWWYDPDSTASFAHWTLAPVYIATDEYFWWLPAAAIPLPVVEP